MRMFSKAMIIFLSMITPMPSITYIKCPIACLQNNIILKVLLARSAIRRDFSNSSPAWSAVAPTLSSSAPPYSPLRLKPLIALEMPNLRDLLPKKPLIASGIAPRNAPTPTPPTPPSTSPPTALVNFLGVRYIMCSCSLHISVAHTVPHISQWLHVYTVKYDCSEMSFHIRLVSTTSHPHSRYTRSS